MATVSPSTAQHECREYEATSKYCTILANSFPEVSLSLGDKTDTWGVDFPSNHVSQKHFTPLIKLKRKGRGNPPSPPLRSILPGPHESKSLCKHCWKGYVRLSALTSQASCPLYPTTLSPGCMCHSPRRLVYWTGAWLGQRGKRSQN